MKDVLPAHGLVEDVRVRAAIFVPGDGRADGQDDDGDAVEDSDGGEVGESQLAGLKYTLVLGPSSIRKVCANILSSR